jgi:hypothetical protein
MEGAMISAPLDADVPPDSTGQQLAEAGCSAFSQPRLVVQEEDTSASLEFSSRMRAFPGVRRCGIIFRHPFETFSELVYECRHSEGEFTTSGLEMLLGLWWQPVDREKHSTHSASHHTSDEALRGLLGFLGFSIHTWFLSFLLILAV